MLFGSLIVAGMLSDAVQAGAEAAPARTPVERNAVSVTASAPASRADMPARGSAAPDFTYQSTDDLWQNLHNVLEQGNVLLVFGASDADMRALERDRESLQRRGVLPMVVIERRDVDAWSVVQRLSLTYSLLADPNGVIGEQYGVLDPATHRSRPAWFVIDTKGRVRQSGQGAMPSRDWTAAAVEALGLPAEGAARAASAE